MYYIKWKELWQKRLSQLIKPGGGGDVSKESVVQSACQYDVTFRVSKWRAK